MLINSPQTILRRRCSNRRMSLASGWRRQELRSSYSRASVLVRTLRARVSKNMTQFSSCVYCVIVRSHLKRAVHCVSWVHLSKCLIFVTNITTCSTWRWRVFRKLNFFMWHVRFCTLKKKKYLTVERWRLHCSSLYMSFCEKFLSVKSA
jgi:hypothetical protein